MKRFLTAAVALLLAAPCGAQTPRFDAWFEADDFAAIETEADRLLAASAADRTGLVARARLGLAYDDASKLDAAVAAMQQCLAGNARDATCHLWLGRAYGRKALDAGMLAGVRYAGRIKHHFERAVELDPASIEARASLNQFYLLAPSLAGGGKTKARANTEAYARLRAVEAELLAAQVDLAEEKFDLADKRLLGFGAATDGAVLDLWQQQLAALGFAYLSRPPVRLDDAQRVFEFAARRFPKNELFRRGLGRTAQELGDYELAARRFEEALAIKPQPGAHYRLAQVAEKLGDLTRAVLHYEKTLRFPRGVPAAVQRDASDRLRVLKAA